jgi:hypothetical protein
MNKKLVSENPFYGLKNLFALYQNKTKDISRYLDSAWSEAKTNSLFVTLFHIICFSIGDITNRKHNIFGKKTVDSGGDSASPQWITYLQWLIKNQPKQFVRFLPYIVEYVGIRELLSWQIRTTKGKKNISGVWGLLGIIQSNDVCYDGLVKYLVRSINGNDPFLKHQIAKYMKIPRHSKRIHKTRTGEVKGKRDLQKNTTAKMQTYGSLVSRVSEAMGWVTTFKETHIEYTGYREWQKQYNKDLEFVLFSTNKIHEFDKERFTNWLNQLPSGARYRVQRRLFDHNDQIREKYTKLGKWFNDWRKAKESLQAEQRVLEQKARTTGLTDKEKEKLVEVKKQAKVTTGAKTLFDSINDLLIGKSDDITIQSILDKVEFNVPVLPIVDISGSMAGRPTSIAKLLTTLVLLKNPNTFENLLFRFATVADCITDNSVGMISNNRFMGKQSIVVKKLIDRELTFRENFNSISNFVSSNGGSTNFDGVANKIKEWVDSVDGIEREHRREQINDYPVFLVASDGDLNSSHSAGASMTQFMMKMKQWFGWDGVVVIWDIPKYGDSVNKSGYFDNIEGVIHVTTYNLSTINQIFTKIHDLDVIDIYTPLKSLMMSDRYEPVKLVIE